MLQNFPQSYAAFTEALTIEPDAADLWYNRWLACRYTCRSGRSVRDFERAVALNKNPALQKQFEEALKDSRKFAQESLKMRGKDFTLEQLIEQEDHFQRGLTYLEAQKWEEAEQEFRTSIAMGDCLPQPWGNLGSCLLMQERYDEAEAAWKRALVIDPKYTLAKMNLDNMANYRREGPPKMSRMFDPFKNIKLKQSITFVSQ
jgi:tetratricopeptide (TPR) repeat protein